MLLYGSVSHEGNWLGENIGGWRWQTALSVLGGKVIWWESSLLSLGTEIVHKYSRLQLAEFRLSSVLLSICNVRVGLWLWLTMDITVSIGKKHTFIEKNNFIRYLRIQWIHFPSLWLCLERFRLLIWSFSGEKNDYRHFETSRHKDTTVIDKTWVKPSQKLERSWWLLICHRLWQC